MSVVLIYVTCATQEEAKVIANALIERRLVACANIFPPHQSIYRWEDKVENSEETAMLLKTCESYFHQVKRTICAMHSYECPCIVMLPVKSGHDPFLEWVSAQLGDI